MRHEARRTCLSGFVDGLVGLDEGEQCLRLDDDGGRLLEAEARPAPPVYQQVAGTGQLVRDTQPHASTLTCDTQSFCNSFPIPIPMMAIQLNSIMHRRRSVPCDRFI